MTMLDFDLDLDAARKRRAAEREGKRQDAPIRIGGEVIAVLPVELPVDVLAPLRNLDGDITLLLRETMQAARAEKDAQWDTTSLFIDVLAQNPNLPMKALDTLTEIGNGLLGEEGLAKLMAARPSPQDLAVLGKGVFTFYGITLGEASPSSDSSTDASGGTSNGTSSTTSGSTPEESGETPTTPGSSAPDGS